MKKFIYTCAALVLTTLAGCQEMELDNAVNAPEAIEDETAEIMASTDGEATRTLLSGRSVIWKRGDAINLFYGYANSSKFTLKSGAGTTNAKFTCSRINKTGGEIAHRVSVYPYDALATLSYNHEAEAYSIKTQFPASQEYVSGSFGSGTSPMMAITEAGNLRFRNVGATIKLRIKSAVEDVVITKIVVTTTSGRKLAGEVNYTMGVAEGSVPSMELTDNAATEITLTCSKGVRLSTTELSDFFFSLPPMVGDNKFGQEELQFHFYNDKDATPFVVTKVTPFECPRSVITVIGGADGYLYDPDGTGGSTEPDTPETPDPDDPDTPDTPDPDAPGTPDTPDDTDDSVHIGVGDTPSVPDANTYRGTGDDLWSEN